MEIRFKLNPKNEKDKVIIDVLSGEYSPAETIKNILYKMAYKGYCGRLTEFNGNDNIEKESDRRQSLSTGGKYHVENVLYKISNDRCIDEDIEDLLNLFDN